MFTFIQREELELIKPEVTVLSASRLAAFAESPKTYKSQYILKEIEPTPAMEMGKIYHKAILEADKFEDEYVVMETKENFICTVEQLKDAIKACGEKPVSGKKQNLIDQLNALDPNARIWEMYVAEMNQQGKKLISAELWKKCQRMTQEVLNHDLLAKFFTEGQKEIKATWKFDEEIYFNMVMDFFHPNLIDGDSVIMDIKTTADASPRACYNTVKKNKLLLQAAIYVDGVKQITGKEPYFGWAFVESSPPYHVTVIMADSGQLELGQRWYRGLIKEFMNCKRSNNWPSYDNGRAMHLEIDDWFFKKIEEEYPET
jgi:hypothetical protein